VHLKQVLFNLPIYLFLLSLVSAIFGLDILPNRLFRIWHNLDLGNYINYPKLLQIEVVNVSQDKQRNFPPNESGFTCARQTTA